MKALDVCICCALVKNAFTNPRTQSNKQSYTITVGTTSAAELMKRQQNPNNRVKLWNTPRYPLREYSLTTRNTASMVPSDKIRTNIQKPEVTKPDVSSSKKISVSKVSAIKNELVLLSNQNSSWNFSSLFVELWLRFISLFIRNK